jgi:SSS family solute:Na+ symporter
MIDSIIISVYLVVTIAIGIYAGRGVKTMRDFAIASKTYPTSIMVATITATLIGGESILGISEEMYKYGLVYLLVCSGFIFNRIFLAYVIAPRIGKFDYAISVGDIMHQHYGKFGRVITGIAGMIMAAGYIGGQISGMGFIFHSFFGLPHVVGIVIGLGIVILYSSFGGIRAVTATDVIQFIILIVAVPMVCNVGIDMIGGFDVLMSKIPDSYLTLVPPTQTSWYFISTFLIFLIPFLGPAMMQRLLMAQSIKQARNSLLITGGIEVVFFVLVALISATALVLKPDLDPHLVVNYLIDNILPVGIKGFVVAGMLAIIMSTADSYLNVASISFVHDIIRPLKKQRLLDKAELWLAKFSTLIIGMIALFAAINLQSVMEIVLNFVSFWGPVIVIPLYAVIFGFNVDKRSFIISSIVSIINMIIWKAYITPVYGISVTIPGLILSLIVFTSANYVFINKKPKALKI